MAPPHLTPTRSRVSVASTGSPTRSPQSSPSDELWRDPLFNFEDDRAHIIKDELEAYLEEACLRNNEEDNEQVMKYWLGKQYDYPILFQMARDYLGIPATSASSDRVFSDGGRIITRDRCRVEGEKLKWVICLRDWGIITEEILELLSEEEIERILVAEDE